MGCGSRADRNMLLPDGEAWQELNQTRVLNHNDRVIMIVPGRRERERERENKSEIGRALDLCDKVLFKRWHWWQHTRKQRSWELT